MLLQNSEKQIEKLHAVNEQYKFHINAIFPFGKLFNFREYIPSPALRINSVCLDSQIIWCRSKTPHHWTLGLSWSYQHMIHQMIHGPEENLLVTGNCNFYGQIQSWGGVEQMGTSCKEFNIQAKVINIIVQANMYLALISLELSFCWFRWKMIKILLDKNKLLEYFGEIITETNTIPKKPWILYNIYFYICYTHIEIKYWCVRLECLLWKRLCTTPNEKGCSIARLNQL